METNLEFTSIVSNENNLIENEKNKDNSKLYILI